MRPPGAAPEQRTWPGLPSPRRGCPRGAPARRQGVLASPHALCGAAPLRRSIYGLCIDDKKLPPEAEALLDDRELHLYQTTNKARALVFQKLQQITVAAQLTGDQVSGGRGRVWWLLRAGVVAAASGGLAAPLPPARRRLV